MATTLSVAPPADDRRLLAPLWHTAVLVIFVVSYSLLQIHFSGHTENVQLKSRVGLYLFAISFEFILLAYVWFLGIRGSGTKFRDVIGGRWANSADVWRDIGVAFLFWLAVIVFLILAGHLLGENLHAKKAFQIMMPRSALEMCLWVLLSISAGFCEEFIFRGYLQKTVFRHHWKQRDRHRCASARVRRGSWLPGRQGHDLDHALRRAFRYSCHDAEEPTSRNDSTLPARRLRRHRLELAGEVPPQPTLIILLKLSFRGDFPAVACGCAKAQLHLVAAQVFVVQVFEPFAQLFAGAFF